MQRRRSAKRNPPSRRPGPPGTIGHIRSFLRREAPFIADQYSKLWDEMVTDFLLRYEKHYKMRIADDNFNQLHDYGLEQVRKLGLPPKTPNPMPHLSVKFLSGWGYYLVNQNGQHIQVRMADGRVVSYFKSKGQAQKAGAAIAKKMNPSRRPKCGRRRR